MSDKDSDMDSLSPLFPLMISLEGMEVVVVGGGVVAERKVSSMIDCGARVTVVAPEVTDRLAELAASGTITILARPYCHGDLAGAALAFAAVDDAEVSRLVAEEAESRGIPINVVDQPDLCTFTVPAVVRRGRLTIAISTGGASPAWARHIKENISAQFRDEYTRLFDALAKVRRFCLEEITDATRRREVLEKLADESLIELARRMSARELEEYLLEQVREGWGSEVTGKEEKTE